MNLFTIIALLLIATTLIGIALGVMFDYLIVTPSGALDLIIWSMILTLFFIVMGMYV